MTILQKQIFSQPSQHRKPINILSSCSCCVRPHLKISMATDSLKSLPTQKVFIWISDRSFFFHFRNFGSVSVIVISVSAFYCNRKLLLIRLRECKKKTLFTYLPTLFLKGGSAEGTIHIFKCGLSRNTYIFSWPNLMYMYAAAHFFIYNLISIFRNFWTLLLIFHLFEHVWDGPLFRNISDTNIFIWKQIT